MDPIPADHFLAQPRPDILIEQIHGLVDTTTLAAHDFDVDNRTGFMPPQAPVERLPSDWAQWEICLDDAIDKRLQLGDKPDLTTQDAITSSSWRATVRELPVLPTVELRKSEVILRRAHLVLAWLLHFYVHSLPPKETAFIPASITVPLLQVCAQLQLPPVLTYSDDVLYNWSLKTASSAPTPALDNLQCNTLFTSTNDEQEFYLTSARMELRGVEGLELMRATMDELFIGDDLAMRRVTDFLISLANVIKDLQSLLLSVREGCDPHVFYNEIRPWFRGMDSAGRPWVFEGLELDPTLTEPQELSGTSAGQSSLIHAIDAFLGVDRYSHSSLITGTEAAANKQAFLHRMQLYMPRHHRNFLRHLAANPRPLRDIVMASAEEHPKLLEAYNAAVRSLKELRDAHLIIVTTYIVQPARREAKVDTESTLVGTGGTQLMKFLKDVRNGTNGAMLS
ncbi:Indoleamine 2,3-dioxygenase [Mycena floridula]|nr:Indoleamine 2,3-dioxygenase [Mycena floridula]